MSDRRQHWERVYESRSEREVSWYRPHLDVSLALIRRLALDRDALVLDVGGGASTLADDLVGDGFRRVVVLDVSQAALSKARARLEEAARSVEWLCGDVLEVELAEHEVALWHDRAVFHFLIDASERAAYVARLESALAPDGHVVLGTFSLDGPPRCSGLDVRRYSAETLTAELGPAFELEEAATEVHRTPSGVPQSFTYALFRRT